MLTTPLHPRQRFAALPWNQCESVRPLAVDSDKADRLLGYGNACCGYSTGSDFIGGVMPGYFSTSAPHLQEWATQTLQPRRRGYGGLQSSRGPSAVAELLVVVCADGLTDSIIALQLCSLMMY